jgi:Flp pilus assembly CpaE family ATPase
MANSFAILMIEDHAGDAERIREMLGQESAPFALEHAGSLTEGLDRLARGGIDLVLLDLCLTDSVGLETFRTLRALSPAVPVVVLSGLENESVALQAVQAGAQDYLVKGRLTAAALARALRYAMLRHEKHAAAGAIQTGETVAFLSAKGGVGTSTLACHFALEVRRQTGQDTLLADLDLYAGNVGFLLKVGSPYSVLDAANHFHHLDLSCWKALVCTHGSGLEVMPAPGPLHLEERAPGERWRHVVRFTRLHYRWVILDLGRLSLHTRYLYEELQRILLVTTFDVPALFEARRVVGALKQAGVELNGVRAVINRCAQPEEISREEISEAIGVPVEAVLSDRRAELAEAYTRGELLPASSRLRREIAALAARVAGCPAPAPRRRLAISWLPRWRQGAASACESLTRPR